MNICKLFDKIQELLQNPDTSNALDANIASELKLTPEIHKKNVIEKTKAQANKPIDELMEDILGKQVAKDSELYKQKK